MKPNSFTYRFASSKTPEEIFSRLTDIEKWWSGLYQETITGEARRPGDEFSFEAGGGMHYSKQKLVEWVPGERIAWEVTDSNLSFLQQPGEWTGTKISFTISRENGQTMVEFTHDGLTPDIECYRECSAGWTGYLHNLANDLK